MKKLIILTLFASVNMQINAQSKIGFNVNDDFDVTGNPVANYGISLISGVGHHYVGLSGFFGLNLYTDKQERLKILRNGYVGIGNTKPTALLNVGTSTTNSPSTLVQFGVSKTNAEARVLSLINSGGGANQSTSIDFHNGPDWSPTGKINVRQIGNTTNSALHFYTYNGGLKNRMTINEHGKVGIGTTTPGMKLEIGNLGEYDGIKIGSIFKIRNSSKGTNNFVLEKTAQDGNLYIRSKTNTNHSGNLILNDIGGNVGIGTYTPKGWKLAVNGNIRAKEIKVEATGWPDYVFYDNYNLPTLKEVESYIKEKGHLKNIPSAINAEKNGILLGKMNSKLLQKIEELTLYTIAQEKKIDKQAEEFKILKSLLEKLIETKK